MDNVSIIVQMEHMEMLLHILVKLVILLVKHAMDLAIKTV